MKTLRILVLILIAGFAPTAWGQQPTCKFSPLWAEFHKENMQRWNRCEKTLGVNNVGSLSLKWSYGTDGSVASSPAVANGVVYVGADDGNLYALNAHTGEILWSEK